jgi:glutamate formiminotransferase/formiminotetrahydrofolate cyclodeaminase
MSLNTFSAETASESPAPGGGSISAYVGALGISLGTMVANLSSSKKGWEDKWEEFSDWAVKGQKLRKELLALVDEDTRSFNAIMDAFQLPKSNESEVAARKNAIQAATKYAIEVPFKVMQLSLESMDIIKVMAEKGNPNSVSDAGVGALCARTAVSGAFLNVRINGSTYNDKKFVEEMVAKGSEIEKKALALEAEVIKIVINTL